MWFLAHKLQIIIENGTSKTIDSNDSHQFEKFFSKGKSDPKNKQKKSR